MSDGLGSLIGSLCKRPFTCCATFTFILIATPLVWGIIGLLDARKLDCGSPAQAGLLVSILCHATNFFFITYLMSKYGKKKKIQKKNTKNGVGLEVGDKSADITQEPNKDQTLNTNRKRSSSQNEIKTEKKNISFDPDMGDNVQVSEPENEKSISIIQDEKGEFDSILAIFAKKIGKDKIIWIYILFIGFLIYWHIHCLVWISEIPPTNICRIEAKGKVMIGGLRLSIFFMWLYLVIGGSLTGFTITIRGCQQGSCNPWDINRAFILWITCGYIDIKDKSSNGMLHFETSKERFEENVKEYSESKAKYIEQNYNLLNNLGLGGKPVKTKHIHVQKKVEVPHGVSLDIKSFDQVNVLNTTMANLNQPQVEAEMIDTSPNLRKISGGRKPKAQLGIPTIKPFNKM